jgi:hypothetical protein
MVTALSVYGMIFGMLLNIKSNTVVKTIIKKSFYLMAVLMPIFFMKPDVMLVYLPVVTTLFHRFLFGQKNKELKEFLVLFIVLVLLLKPSFLWISTCTVLLLVSNWMLFEGNYAAKRLLSLVYDHLFDFLIMIVNLFFFILMNSVERNSEYYRPVSFLVLMSLILFCFRVMGVLTSGSRLRVLKKMNTEDRLLLDTISLYVIPITLLSHIKEIYQIIQTSFLTHFLSIILISSCIGYYIYARNNLRANYSRLVYLLNALALIIGYLSIPILSYSSLKVLMFVNFCFYAMVYLIDKYEVPYKKIAYVITLLLLFPTFLSPNFYAVFKNVGFLLEDSQVLTMILMLTLSLSPLGVSFVPFNIASKIKVKANVSVEGKNKVIYWSLVTFIVLVSAKYGKISY